MTYASLAEFLTLLQDNDELVRISAIVDPSIEIAAITDRVSKRSNGGPALLFENVKNSTVPVVTNLLGSTRRLALCFGHEDWNNLDCPPPGSAPQGGWLNTLMRASTWGPAGQWLPKLVKTAASQQVVRVGRDVNLWDLPVLRSWPAEADPVISAATLVTCHPETKASCCYQTSLVVRRQSELGWYDADPEQRDLIQSAIRSQQNLPVSIYLGSDPLLGILAGISGVGEIRQVAGQFRQACVEVVRCRTNDLEVPATAEFVIEGYVDVANPYSEKGLTVARGNGSYVTRELPVVQVTAITHRANPVFPASVVGYPPCEESWIGRARLRLLLPAIRQMLPEIVDMHQPVCAASRNLLFVSIRKRVEHQARRVLNALWGLERIGQSKIIVIVDDDVDVESEAAVWLTVGNHVCPSRDFLFSDGLARDDDYTSLTPTLASRVGIDATRKNEHELEFDWPQTLKTSDEMTARMIERWSEYGLGS